MITFHVSKKLFQQLKREGKMTIVRDRVKSWTDRFQKELGMTFPDKVSKETARYEGTANEVHPVCLVKLQNIDETLNATVVSVCLEQDHLGKWKYMITVTCVPEGNDDSIDKKVYTWASVFTVIVILTLIYVLFF